MLAWAFLLSLPLALGLLGLWVLCRMIAPANAPLRAAVRVGGVVYYLAVGVLTFSPVPHWVDRIHNSKPWGRYAMLGLGLGNGQSFQTVFVLALWLAVPAGWLAARRTAPGPAQPPAPVRERAGDFVEVPIAPAIYCYARLANGGAFLFYDFTSPVPLDDLGALAAKAVVLGLGVMRYATRARHWKIVGHSPLPAELARLAERPGLVRAGEHSPMTAEHALRAQFGVKGFEALNEHVPWQGWARPGGR